MAERFQNEVFPATFLSFPATSWYLANLLSSAFRRDPSTESSNRQALQDCLRDNELRGVPLADFPLRVQNLEQSRAELSQNFDGLHNLHLPNTLISKGEPPRKVWNPTCPFTVVCKRGGWPE